MALQSIGDLAQSFVMRRQSTQLTQQMDRLTREVSTGRVVDTAKHLAGNMLPLADIDRALTLADAHRSVARVASVDASVMQSALARVQDEAGELAEAALISGPAAGPIQPDILAHKARGALAGMIGALNSASAGRALFGGDVADRPPLAGSELLLDELRATLATAPDAAAVRAALDDFFDAPGGGFAATIYRGGEAPAAAHALGSGETVTLRIRADDAALRDQIRQTAMLAVLDDPAIALSVTDRLDIARDMGAGLLAGQDGVTRLRAQLGFAEDRIGQAQSRIQTEMTTLGIARNDLVSADVFESATALEQVQTQLQMLYTITARTARLNLVNFLS